MEITKRLMELPLILIILPMAQMDIVEISTMAINLRMAPGGKWETDRHGVFRLTTSDRRNIATVCPQLDGQVFWRVFLEQLFFFRVNHEIQGFPLNEKMIYELGWGDRPTKGYTEDTESAKKLASALCAEFMTCMKGPSNRLRKESFKVVGHKITARALLLAFFAICIFSTLLVVLAGRM